MAGLRLEAGLQLRGVEARQQSVEQAKVHLTDQVGADGNGLEGRAETATNDLPLVAALRWLFFLALAGVVGGLVGECLIRRTVPAAALPRSLVRSAAAVGALAAGGLLIHLAVAVGWSGRAGTLLAIAAGGFVLTALLGLGIHLFAISVWVGALVELLRAARLNRSTSVRPAFALYARVAIWLFLLVVVSGTTSALLLVPRLSDLTGTAYGRVLLIKLVLVATVAILAWTARRSLGRDRHPVARPASIEATSLIAVVAVSAILVSLPTPAPAGPATSYPPTVTGPVVRLGTLAGQIAVGIAASDGQVEVRTRVPDDGVRLGESDPPPFRVTARATVTGRPGAAVPLRPCGPGCFVGAVSWRTCTTTIDVRADAPGWHGGAAVFQIPGAPRVSPDLLGRVRAAMRGRQTIRVVETVTSDTSQPAPPTHMLTVSGPEFLESEPYGDPPDPAASSRPLTGGRTLLTFGLPAEGIYGELELDSSYRIIRETLAAPKHLTHRTFTYPS